jgi:hypothetical protein
MSGKRASQIIFIFCRTIIIKLHNLHLLFNLSGCGFLFVFGFEVENKISEKIDSLASVVVEGLCVCVCVRTFEHHYYFSERKKGASFSQLHTSFMNHDGTISERHIFPITLQQLKHPRVSKSLSMPWIKDRNPFSRLSENFFGKAGRTLE